MRGCMWSHPSVTLPHTLRSSWLGQARLSPLPSSKCLFLPFVQTGLLAPDLLPSPLPASQPFGPLGASQASLLHAALPCPPVAFTANIAPLGFGCSVFTASKLVRVLP